MLQWPSMATWWFMGGPTRLLDEGAVAAITTRLRGRFQTCGHFLWPLCLGAKLWHQPVMNLTPKPAMDMWQSTWKETKLFLSTGAALAPLQTL